MSGWLGLVGKRFWRRLAAAAAASAMAAAAPLAGVTALGGLLAPAAVRAQGLAPSSANALPHELAAAWRASKLPGSSLSLVVQELGGQRLLSINAKAPRNPASVMKLVTTWAGLSSLGPNYVWRTELLSDPGARLANGVLSGPLYLRASGDPFFLLQDFWTLLRDLRLHGVRQIQDLVIDRSIFGSVGSDPGAFDGAPDRPYNASPDALMVGFGALRLLFIPDPAARRWRPVIDPPLPGVSVSGQLEWSDAPCPGSPEVATEPVITQQGVTLRLSGKVAGSCGEFSLYRLALSQPEFATEVFRLLWRELGGTFAGQVRSGLVPPDAVPLASHDSPPLGDVIRTINKRSNNVMARQLLLTLGAEGGLRSANEASSADVVRRVLAGQGLSMPELVIDNGSGLSRIGRISADSLASLLTVAWNSPYMPEFMSSLAIAGVDGTVRRRLRDKDTRGMAHLKTGTLANVRALAGYVLSASGKRYAVVSIVNDDRADAVRPFDDALIKWLVDR
nr:D-alanyl-D-alanine carboxypeptidase/D-alanyl-D-alanine-endopeptidase [Bordetella genomosp. 9]